MEQLKRQQFLHMIDDFPHGELQIMGIQNGKFLLIYHVDGQSYIYCKLNGRHKEYTQVAHILDWVKRKTKKREARIRFDLWHDNCYQRARS